MTPLDKLAGLPDVHTCLREGITLEHLREMAMALTDVQAAEETQRSPPGAVRWTRPLRRTRPSKLH